MDEQKCTPFFVSQFESFVSKHTIKVSNFTANLMMFYLSDLDFFRYSRRFIGEYMALPWYGRNSKRIV